MKKQFISLFITTIFCSFFCENLIGQSTEIAEKIRLLITQEVPENSPKRRDDVKTYLQSTEISPIVAKSIYTKLSNKTDELRVTIIRKTSQGTFDTILEIINAKAYGGYIDKNGTLKKINYSVTITKEPDTTPKTSDDEFKLVIVPMPDNIAFLNNFLFKDGKIKKGHSIKGPDTKNSCYYFYNYTMELAKTRSNFQIQDMQESNSNINTKISSAFNLLSTQKSVTIKL